MAYKHESRSGFTLVELLVVIVIVSLLSALTLGALRTGGIRAKEDSARSFIVHISDSLLELFEELDDQGFTARITGPSNDRSYAVRWQIPVSKNDALYPPGGNPIPPFGAKYRAYARRISDDQITQSAKCLYMIMTQTGYFADFVETLHASQVADLDGNGTTDVLIDPWGTPIRLEFAPAPPPGEDDNGNHVLDPGEDDNENGELDYAVISSQNLPIIRSAGVDLEFDTEDDIVSIDENGIFAQ